MIEWENPLDVACRWTDRAMRALADELAREGAPGSGRPTLLYVFDDSRLDEASVRGGLARSAAGLEQRARVEIVPVRGGTYYQLKNEGARRATTDFVVLLDSDASPQPGWLRALLGPFADEKIMAVSGVTSMEAVDLVSRTMALTWIFDLPSEHPRSRGRASLHANNCAFRTRFFQENPFPQTRTFKKQCGMWLEDVLARGYGFERVPEGHVRHAPQSGLRFVLWRAFQSGLDRDAKAALQGRSRRRRLLRAVVTPWRKALRSTHRIVRLRREVDLPAWQVPAALGVAWSYCAFFGAAQLASAIFDGLPESFRARWA